MVKLALMGDVMLGRGVNAALRLMSPEEPWGDVLPLLLAADHRILNLECPITTYNRPWLRTPKVFHFRADPQAVAVLQAARVDAVSLANNHTLDFEEQGLLDTLAHLEAAGIRCAGAGRDDAQAARPALLFPRLGAPRVALVAFTDNEPTFAAGPGKPGTNYLPVSLDADTLARVESAIADARAVGAEVVVFSNHWGPNMVQRPSLLFREFAHAVMDRGADLYYGHSAHIFQGIEVYRGKPILYDTGEFLDDYAVDPSLHNDWSFLFHATFERARFPRLELWPVALSFARVDLATARVRDAVMDRMKHLSADMGTTFQRLDDRLVLSPEARASDAA